MIKRLIVEEFEIDEAQEVVLPKNFKYSYFKDPETGKYYRPKSTFQVTGEDLGTLFEEVAGDLEEREEELNK